MKLESDKFYTIEFTADTFEKEYGFKKNVPFLIIEDMKDRSNEYVLYSPVKGMRQNVSIRHLDILTLREFNFKELAI